MNKYFLRVLVIGAALAPVSPLAAQTGLRSPAVQCPYCTETQMRAAVAVRGPGAHYVASLPGNVLRFYEVYCNTGGGLLGADGDDGQARKPGASAPGRSPGLQSTCTGTAEVFDLPVEPAVLEVFQIVRQIWLDTDGTFVKQLEVPFDQTGSFWTPPTNPMIPPDAYDVVGDANFRAQLGDALATRGPGPNTFQYLVTLATYVGAMINSVTGMTDGLRVFITVTFRDGSKVQYLFNYGEPTARYQPGTARTPTGQVIPDAAVANTPDSSGTWREFGPYGGVEDLQRFLDYMASMGVRIQGGVDTRPYRTVTCEWDGTNLVCTIR